MFSKLPTITQICIISQGIVIIYLIMQITNKSTTSKCVVSIDRTEKSRSELVAEFFKIGMEGPTDKVDGHSYQHLYGPVLAHIRNKKINFLEIGLGCNMPYGPGRSLKVWRKYFTHPETEIVYLEYNQTCAEKFRQQLNKLFVGDQANFDLLKRVGIEGGPYDVIVDDGGHKRSHMINSFIGLWPYLKDGGIYVIEDMHTAFDGSYTDRNESVIDLVRSFLVLFNEGSAVSMPVSSNLKLDLLSVFKTLYHFDCYKEICSFFKKP